MTATPRAFFLRARRWAVGLPLLLTSALVLGAVPAQAGPTSDAAGVTAVNTQDRAAVAAAYRNVYLPAVAVRSTPPPADTVATCDAGAPSAKLQDATLDLVNYFRAMSGVAPVTFDPDLSARAQKAALIGYANSTLSHVPSSRLICWTTAGAEAAARSNLGLGYAGADVVRTYMDDAGADNTAAGHRWWLQRPSTVTMGNGMVGSSNALWVVGESGYTVGPRYTSWPAAGYLPAGLEPQGRWSLTAWDPDYDLSRATAAVTGPTGAAVPVRQAPIGAYGSLVFDLDRITPPTGSRVDAYTVTVSGILKRGEPVAPYSYRVSIFDPAAGVALEPTAPPQLSGTAQVGQRLSVTVPTWSLPQVTTSYQWYRGSNPIPGATAATLLLTPDDVGQRIRVTATGTLAGRDPVQVSSVSSSAVRSTATVTAAATSALVGALKLTVSIAAPGTPAPGGTVTVKEGATTVASKVPVVNGRATWSGQGLKSGRHTYTVSYSGTTVVAPATATVTATVRAKATPKLTLKASSPSRGKVTVVTTITASGVSSPGGTVTVKEGSKTLKSKLTVSKGKATWTATKVKAGKHTYTVAYNGTSQINTGSAKVTVTVKK